jgi:uncharacterized protein YcaQ
VIELSAAEARRLLLRRQGLGASAERRGRAADRVAAMLRRLGAVQLDTISVMARSHELVAYARLGAVGRTAVEAAYWGRPPRAFEYWAHAACVLPIEEWPWFEARRRRNRARRERSERSTEAARTEVLSRLADLGPVTTADLGGAKNGAGIWWDWSPLKLAVEELLAGGEVVCVDRRRAERTLGFSHRLEAYVPRDLREHGYFVMPLLAGGRIRGRVDPARRGRTLVARRVSVERGAVAAMARALVEAATWVGCDAVAVEEVVPAELGAPLRAEVAALGG